MRRWSDRGSGTKSLTWDYNNQAQDIVAPDRILLDKTQKLVANENEGRSLLMVQG